MCSIKPIFTQMDCIFRLANLISRQLKGFTWQGKQSAWIVSLFNSGQLFSLPIKAHHLPWFQIGQSKSSKYTINSCKDWLFWTIFGTVIEWWQKIHLKLYCDIWAPTIEHGRCRSPYTVIRSLLSIDRSPKSEVCCPKSIVKSPKSIVRSA